MEPTARPRGLAVFFLLAAILAMSALVLPSAPRASDSPRALAVAPAAASGGQLPGSTSAFQDSLMAEDPVSEAIVASDTHHDMSPPLRDIPPLPPGPPQPNHEAAENPPLFTLDDLVFRVDPVAQNWMGSSAMPAPSVNFDGLTNADNASQLGYQVQPPDSEGGVGPNHYVQWVNSIFAVYDKTGTRLYGPAAGNTLWSGFGGACETRNDGDPIVLYDSISDRWLVSQFTTSNPYAECIAISASPNPLGPWYRYQFTLSTRQLYDYPHGGVWPDAYYFAFNRFRTFFVGPSAIAFERDKMLIGATARYVEFQLSTTTYGSLLPSDLDGGNLPPTGAPDYFVDLKRSSPQGLNLWKFHVDWVNTASSTFGVSSAPNNTLNVAAFTQLCAGTRDCVPQPVITQRVDGLGDRLMWRLAYRNFGDHESLVVNHAVSDGGVAGERWYEIRSPNSSPTIYQQGTFRPDTLWRWSGSIAMDRQGNAALGYTVSGTSSGYPKVAYVGRLAGDTLGTLPQAEVAIVSSTGQQNGGNRWGDYSAMDIDPTDDCTFWYTHQYLGATDWSPWRMRIGAFKFPACAAPTPCFSDSGATFDNFNHTATSAAGDDWAVDATTGNPAPSFKVGDPASVSDKSLVLNEAIPVGPATVGTNLVFDHKYALGPGDGAVLEGSTDGGLTWAEINSRIATGAYSTTIASATNPLNGRMAWTSSISAWQKVTVNLSQQFPNANVLIRWRFASDNATGGSGWWIDNIRVENCAADRDLLSGHLYADCNNNNARETAYNEAGISGVTLNLGGDATGTATTNAQGYWQFSVPAAGSTYFIAVDRTTLPYGGGGAAGAPAAWNAAMNGGRCTGTGWTAGSTTYWGWGEHGGGLSLTGVGMQPEGMAPNTRLGMRGDGGGPTIVSLQAASVQSETRPDLWPFALAGLAAAAVSLALLRRRA